MASDLDIRRAARVMVTRHGADAPVHAAMRADERLANGDLDGAAVWKRILAACEDLLRPPAPNGVDVLH